MAIITPFFECRMGLSDGAFFMIKHTPLPNGNHPISSPVCPTGVADMMGTVWFTKKSYKIMTLKSQFKEFEVLCKCP